MTTNQQKRPHGNSLKDFKIAGKNTPNKLLPAEEKLLRAAKQGRECWISKKCLDKNTNINVIRGKFLRFLLLGGDSKSVVHENGIRLVGAFIDGDINLTCSDYIYFMSIRHCQVNGDFIGYNTCFENIDFEGSCINSIDCANSTITSNVFLRNGFVAHKDVSFHGANIGGQLTCSQGEFKKAINCENVKISGDVFLNNDFTAQGEVRFVGAEIGCDYICTGGKFKNDQLRAHTSEPLTKSDALNLSGVKIIGTLWLGPGIPPDNVDVDVEGSINLQGAQVTSFVDREASWPKRQQNEEVPSVVRLDGFVFERFFGEAPTKAAMRLKWLKLQPKHHLYEEFRPQPFEQVAKVLRNMGYEDDARQISMFKQDFVWRQRVVRDKCLLNLLTWLLGLLWKHCAGYGYQPRRLMFMLVIMWGVCTFFYYIHDNTFVPVDAQIWTNTEIVKNCKDNWTSCCDVSNLIGFNALFYSADVLLPIIDLRQRSTWMPMPGWIRGLTWLENIAGTIGVLLLGAILGGLVKRD